MTTLTATAPKIKAKLNVIREQIFAVNPSAGQAPAGDLKRFFSHRLTFRDRLVCTVSDSGQRVFIRPERTHDGAQ